MGKYFSTFLVKIVKFLLQVEAQCNDLSIYMFDGLPMNNSILTVNGDICSDLWKEGHNRSPHEYKTILDIAYMIGTCVGGEVFHLIGETYGLRFSLGFAMFTTFLGSSLGVTVTNPNLWSVSSFSSG